MASYRSVRASVNVSAMFFALGCGHVRHASLDDGWSQPQAAQAGPPGAPLAPAPRASAVPPERRIRWRYADRALALQPLTGREPSEHLGGGYERTVRINPLAAGYPRLDGLGTLPEGALVLQDHHPPGSEAVVASFAMVKLAPGTSAATGDWDYAVLDDLLREMTAGDLSLCARCHAAAPHHGLFGPPRPVSPKQPAGQQ